MNFNLADWFIKRAQSANPYQKKENNRQIEIEILLKLLNAIDYRFDLNSLELIGDDRVSIGIDGQATELSNLSSGFASLLKVLQAIVAGYANFTNEVQLTHVPGIVLIDEIESHLHSEWQAKIISLLKRLFPNTTFYVATHSPLVLTQLQQGEAYVLERDPQDNVVRSSVIKAPNNRIFVDVLKDAFGVDLNAIKAQRLRTEDQTAAKEKLLALLLNEGDA